jgi:ribosomal protein S18 acetylase RimI-like enzyme
LPIVRIAADAIVGQYGLVQIRPFEAADAPAAELVGPLQPGILVTPPYLVHRESSEPERAQRRSWLALENDEVLGFSTSSVKWDEPGAVGRFWIGVRPDRREAGIGAALYDLAERHARAVGVRRLTVEVDDDPDGLRFVEARGFERVSAEIVSSLDPQLADLGELDALLAETSGVGFELTTLEAMAGRQDDLAAFYEAAGAWPPGGEANRITADDLWRYIFERPELSWEGSFVVLDDQGRLGDNVPMLTLNQRLGYRRLYAQVELARAL